MLTTIFVEFWDKRASPSFAQYWDDNNKIFAIEFDEFRSVLKVKQCALGWTFVKIWAC